MSLPTVTREKMREMDRRAIEDYAIPSLILMENAGLHVADAVEKIIGCKHASAAVVCGRGNNGGDGLVVARHLANRGHKVSVYLFSSACELKGDALTNLTIWMRMGGSLLEVVDDVAIGKYRDSLYEADIIVDALFGTGLDKDVSGLFMIAIGTINDAGKPVVSIDIPSGLCANTGKVMGVAVKASLTVTLGLPKEGFKKGQGPSYCGKIEIADISLPRKLIEQSTKG